MEAETDAGDEMARGIDVRFASQSIMRIPDMDLENGNSAKHSSSNFGLLQWFPYR
jgi:hypothetical protein